ncbi:UvrD-helicase domain-containing protein [Streptomyces sp. 4N509B]|uniref:UvrD-helicase domain-containing protein n=1 Tax=Streptomyces sp. 4N509B TaxID=3457413 RepID=UPI003FCFAB16
MRFHADLHIHSKFSRACSKDCDLEHLTWWARRKGITLVGTGDFTHPAWFAHLKETLVPAEPGLFRLRDDLDRDIARTLPPRMAAAPVRFMLSVEISTIYKRADRTRKVHHLIYMPDFAAAEAFNARLGRIGNITSDGRPILGLDSHDLLEIVLECGRGEGYLIPAHVWTPWFAVFGSKSGFDAIEDCYLELSEHIFALETGLSSDPAMNWRISALDRYRLVSNSDAHSPPMLGRETTLFDTELDYFAVRRALETGVGHAGTVEFFPEEGKYHVDGHRACGVRLEPEETRERGGRCPACGKPLTVGVLSRVLDLADRPEGFRLAGAAPFHSLVPLPEMMSEILGVGPKSKKVRGELDALTAALGPELPILQELPVDEIAAHHPLLGEAVARLRRGEVIRDAGYDGEYGVIRLFEPGELKKLTAVTVPTLFGDDDGLFGSAETLAGPARAVGPAGAALPGQRTAERSPEGARPAPVPTQRAAGSGDAAHRDSAGDGTTTPRHARPAVAGGDAGGTGRPAPASPPAPRVPSLLDGLDPEQRAAAGSDGGPLLIIAGPGTGKTRTLTHRVAHLVTERGVPPEQCLAITFTRRAAEEMAERLAALAPAHAPGVTVATFHSLGLAILREQHERAGLGAGFGIADAARQAEIAEAAGDDERGEAYRAALRAHDLVDFDDLIALPLALLAADPALAAAYQDRYRWISVDEYQDVDERQYRLLRLLSPSEGAANLTAIGDPDQAIYRFRGADVGFFLRFQRDYPGARTVHLSRNYRSAAPILAASLRAIAPSSLVPDRRLDPMGRGHGTSRPALHAAAGEQAEASFVARTIERLIGGASFHSLDSGRVDTEESNALSELSFSDFAILYRTDAQARVLVETLTRTGLPFQKRSHDRLADRPGVAAVLAALAPTADEALGDALRATLTPASSGEERAAVDLLLPLAAECGADLARFRDQLALGVEVDTWDPRADRISLLTLHASKGLEFPVVFVVGCEDGLLPMRWPGADLDPEAESEERRLLFVGMTRAQRRLYLTHAAERFRHGAVRTAARSPFLDPLATDPALCERVGAPVPRPRAPRDTQLRLL